MYEAIIAKVTNVRDHPNADRLKLATVCGFTIIIGLDTEEGTVGAFFPADGQLSHEHCMANKLYRKDPESGAEMGGYFEHNRRVKAQKFRKVPSEGFWQPLEALKWTGVDTDKLKVGHTFTELNGKLVCNKYISVATQKAMNRAKKEGKAHRDFSMFKRHFETGQLRYNLERIPKGALLHITEKAHGTSGRTAHIKTKKTLGKLSQWWNKYFWKLYTIKPTKEEWIYITGSRRVNMDPDQGDAYYSGKRFRFIIHDELKALSLHKGETLYYEIVGYDDDKGMIMPAHPIKDKELIKRFKQDKMVYSYGCQVDADISWKVLVYRITLTNEDNYTVELPWSQVVARCKELGLETVPHLETFIYNGDPEVLVDKCVQLSSGTSELDVNHIKEGVCVRVESEELTTIYKFKSWYFCDLEGIAKGLSEYVDPEDLV